MKQILSHAFYIFDNKPILLMSTIKYGKSLIVLVLFNF